MSMISDKAVDIPQVQRHIDYLERLGEELVLRGLRARLTVPSGRPPALHVLNPDSVAMSEDIQAEFATDGWWYLWSWEERIGSAEDVCGAADRVERVLYVSGVPQPSPCRGAADPT